MTNREQNKRHSSSAFDNYLRQGGNVFAGLCLFVCLSVCEQDNSKSYGRIFLKFWGYIGNGINYKWFNFGRNPAGILDSGSLWNFRYHCVKGGIRKPLAKKNSDATWRIALPWRRYLRVRLRSSWFWAGDEIKLRVLAYPFNMLVIDLAILRPNHVYLACKHRRSQEFVLWMPSFPSFLLPFSIFFPFCHSLLRLPPNSSAD